MVVAAGVMYIMHSRGLDSDAALAHVQGIRLVSPNSALMVYIVIPVALQIVKPHEVKCFPRLLKKLDRVGI